jgi:hypothetical protein
MNLCRAHGAILALVSLGVPACSGTERETAPVLAHPDAPGLPAAPAVPVRRGADEVARLAPSGTTGTVDLWTLCDDAWIESITAHGDGGGFVHGQCDRQSGALVLRWPGDDAGPVVELVRRGSSDLAARAERVSEIQVDGPLRARDRPPPGAAFFVRVGARAPVQISAEQLGEPPAPGTHRSRRSSRDTPLDRLVERLQIEPASIERVLIHGDGHEYTVDGRWLAAGSEHELLLTRTRRGQARFSHRVAGVEHARIRPVEHIEVQLSRQRPRRSAAR